MRMFGRRINKKSGFSLLELLLCMFALSMLMTVIVSSGRKVKQSAMSTICMNNLRQISIAMATYYNDYKDYPRGLPYDTLPHQLSTYIPDSSVFVCPVDRTEEIDSYSEFYVYRSEQLAKMRYTIGCPRHKEEEEAVNIFSLGRTAQGKVRKIMVDNVPVKPGTTCSGTLVLDDGTTVTSDVSLFVIQSFKMDDGRLYTVIRALDGETGDIQVDATPGTNLEIVTPSLIAAVRGTSYTVSVGYNNDMPVTRVYVSQGEVEVSPLLGHFAQNQTWVGAGRQGISLFPGMDTVIYGDPMKIRKDIIEKRLGFLRVKINRGIAKNMDVTREQSLFKWLAQFVDTDYSDEDWIDVPIDKFKDKDKTLPPFAQGDALPPGSVVADDNSVIDNPEEPEEPETESQTGTPPPVGSDEWYYYLLWKMLTGRY